MSMVVEVSWERKKKKMMMIGWWRGGVGYSYS